jgi:hypothetical protein
MRRTTAAAAVAVALISGTAVLALPSTPSTKGTNMSKLPETGPSLLRHLRQQQRQMVRQVNSSSYNRSGTSVTAEGVTEVDGTLNVVGNLNVSGPAVITGTLSLPAGIIDNAALANPTAFGANGTSAFNFALSTTAADKASMTVPIPAGFTRALVHATVNASVENTSAVYDYFYVRANIIAPGWGSATGGQGFVGLAPGGWGSASASGIANITGLTPGSITVSCLVNAGGGVWAAATSNTANVDATVTFLR